jgi:Tol biopolymer transport system component
MKSIFLFFFILCATTFSSFAQFQFLNVSDKEIRPVLFMEGVVSDGIANRDMAVSPAGDEIFYTIQQRQGIISCIMYMKKTGKTWSAPVVAPFSGRFADFEAAFSPDNKRVYFTSNRPLQSDGKAKDYDIWYVERTAKGWSSTVNVGAPVNTEKDEYYPAMTSSGNLYFTRNMNDTVKEDIVMAEWKNDHFLPPVSLPAAINSNGYEFNAFVNAAETMIIFTGTRRKDDIGGGDLYVSVQNNGQWSEAKNLGPAINSKSIDYCPFVTADGKFLFYTSSRCDISLPIKDKSIPQILKSAGNGLDDIYIVSMPAIIASLK